jgi:hypothetical protein
MQWMGRFEVAWSVHRSFPTELRSRSLEDRPMCTISRKIRKCIPTII